MTTLATRTMHGIDVLIIKEGSRIMFVACADEFSPAAAEECQGIGQVFQSSLIALVPTAPRPQVKPKGILGWFRAVVNARTPQTLRTALKGGWS